MSNTYTADSIESIDPLEFTRLRPGVYCGDTSHPNQLLVELVSNAVDEYVIGHCKNIAIYITDEYIEISDDGQGFPINEMRKDGKTVLEASFSVINTSGKYREDGVYEGTSLGLNGIGAKLANFLSHKCDVSSWNNKGCERIQFIEGKFDKRWTNDNKSSFSSSGTTVIFTPSEEFFKSVKIDMTSLDKFLFGVSCLCPDLTITVHAYGKETIYHHPKGLQDFIDNEVNGKMQMTSTLSFQEKKDKYNLDVALTYDDRNAADFNAFVNYGLTDAGPHITAIKSCITRTLNKWAKQQGILKEKEKNLDGTSLQEGLVLVFNLVAPNISYDAQTKSRIVSNDFVPFLNEVFTEQLEIWLDNNPADGRLIIDKALVARKAAEAAKKAREKVREASKGVVKTKVAVMPSKLTDANSKDRSICELFTVEGDSAAGGAKQTRDANTQAIMPLRGKLLNVLTAQQKTIQANQEIMNIISALGLSWTSDKKSIIYNENQLRYDKFIIAVDSDPDGNHISSLILTFLWTMVPDLLLDGHVYLAMPPLYKVEYNNGNYEYLRDDNALKEYTAKHSGFKLSRFKGLGEFQPDELYAQIMNPETRYLEQIKIENINNFDQTIRNLMGKDSTPKRDFIFNQNREEE